MGLRDRLLEIGYQHYRDSISIGDTILNWFRSNKNKRYGSIDPYRLFKMVDGHEFFVYITNPNIFMIGEDYISDSWDYFLTDDEVFNLIKHHERSYKINKILNYP